MVALVCPTRITKGNVFFDMGRFCHATVMIASLFFHFTYEKNKIYISLRDTKMVLLTCIFSALFSNFYVFFFIAMCFGTWQ